MKRRSVSILASDLSTNNLQRAYTFVRLLEPEFDVHVVGYDGGGGVWGPLASERDIEYRALRARTAAELLAQAPGFVRRAVDGDLLFALKPVATSFGLGLLALSRSRRPLLLDIEEWEHGLLGSSVWWEFRNAPREWFSSPNSPLYTRCLARMTALAHAVTVTNTFLQKRYGGVLIPHARDATTYRAASEPFSSEGHPIVLFLGSARPHKGLQVLLNAWHELAHPTALLRIVGTPLDHPSIKILENLPSERFELVGHVPFAAVPRWIGESDVFVVPQLDHPASIGQLPTKLIEAMALGRAIVSTDVGDIPSWLGADCGFVVPPGDPTSLANALRQLLSRPHRGRELGRRARAKFLREASFDAVRPKLVGLVHEALEGKRVSFARRFLRQAQRSTRS